LILPVIFLMLGGIGLPGGAVYIERWRIRSRYWLSGMSLAGPMANVLVAIVLAIILRVSPVTDSGIWPGLSFLLVLQVSAVFFNLIPLPPFDGYNILEPFLNPAIRMQVDRIRGVSIWIVLLAFWYIPFVSNFFWGAVFIVSAILGVDLRIAMLGLDRFQFWNL